MRIRVSVSLIVLMKHAFKPKLWRLRKKENIEGEKSLRRHRTVANIVPYETSNIICQNITCGYCRYVCCHSKVSFGGMIGNFDS